MATKNGMWFRKNPSQNIPEAQWWEEKCVRRQGGYDFDASNIPPSVRWVPKGTLLKLMTDTGKARVCKTAEVTIKAESPGTTIKVKDTGMLMVGDTLAGSKITAISVADNIATLTVDEVNAVIEAGTVIDDLAETGEKLIGLQYETNDLMGNDFPQCTPTLVAMEIEKDTLPLPINDKLIEKLNKAGVGIHLFREQ